MYLLPLCDPGANAAHGLHLRILGEELVERSIRMSNQSSIACVVRRGGVRTVLTSSMARGPYFLTFSWPIPTA